MKLLWFHLMPYTDLPDDFKQKHPSIWVDIDSRLFDPRKAHVLYNEFMDELEQAAEVGFHGICVNEHHSNAYGMMPSPNIMAAKIASSLERGMHFRRICHWSLTSIMRAGALGAEITLSGKLSSERSRREKFKAGYMPRVGDPALKNLKRTVFYIQLPRGLIGIKVVIVPPDYKSPDRVTIKEVPPEVVEAPKEAAAPTGVAATPTETPPPPEKAGGETEAGAEEESVESSGSDVAGEVSK